MASLCHLVCLCHLVAVFVSFSLCHLVLGLCHLVAVFVSFSGGVCVI